MELTIGTTLLSDSEWLGSAMVKSRSGSFEWIADWGDNGVSVTDHGFHGLGEDTLALGGGPALNTQNKASTATSPHQQLSDRRL